MRRVRYIVASLLVVGVICLASFIPLKSVAQMYSSTIWQTIVLSAIPSGAAIDPVIKQVLVVGGGATGACTGGSGDLTGTQPNCIVNTIGGVTPGTIISLNAPTVGNIPSGLNALLQVEPHDMPGTSTVTCKGTAGTTPYEDRYAGALAGDTSLALPDPTTCAAKSIVSFIPIQDAAHTFAVTGSISGTPIFPLGTSAGDTVTRQYVDLGTFWLLQEGQPYPAQVVPVNAGGTGTTTPKLGVVAYLTSGTTFTPPAGCAFLLFGACGPGGPGAGATTGGSTQCAAPAGSAGICGIMSIIAPSGNVTYSLGTTATAGTNGASPTNGIAGTDTTVTYGGSTQTFSAGTVPIGGTACNGGTGGCQNAACNSGATSGAAAAGANSQIASATGLGWSMILSQGGVIGSNGGSGSPGSKPGTTGNAGGRGGHVTVGGVSDQNPDPGNAAYAWALCFGSSALGG